MRYYNFFKSCGSKFSSDSDEVIICVSHGFSQDATLPLWHSKYKAGDATSDSAWKQQMDVICYGVEYGATTILELGQDNRWTLVGDFGTSEHLGLGKATCMEITD